MVIGAITNLIINVVLIPRYASIGAAIGTLCAECIVWGYQCYKVRNELSIKSYLLNSCPYLMAGVIMYICLINFSIDSINVMVLLMMKIGAGVVIYILSFLVLHWLFKCLFRYTKDRNV